MRWLVLHLTFGSVLLGNPTSLTSLELGTPTTRCCWCVTVRDQVSELFPIQDDASCQSKNDSLMYEKCRPVKLLAKDCWVKGIKHTSSGYLCSDYTLKYLEGNVERTLAPPVAMPYQCKDPSFSADDLPSQPVASADTNPNRLEEESEVGTYCSCERDPTDDKSCLVLIVENHRVIQQFSRRLPSHDSTCTVSTCVTLFLQESKLPQCKRYKQRNP